VSGRRRHPYSQGRAPVSWLCKPTTKTQEQRNAFLVSVSPQYALHATQADAVALSQIPLRRSPVAVVEHLLDGLVAEAVDQSPAWTGQGRGSLVTGVALDPSIAWVACATAARTSWFERRPLRSTRSHSQMSRLG
jgi:hypothetical protein